MNEEQNQQSPKEIVAYIESIFPRWIATEAEIEIWIEAVKEHYKASPYNQPKIAKILEFYRQRNHGAEKREVKIGRTGISIRCVEPPPGKSSYLKFERELIFPCEDQIPGDRNELRRIAENMRDFHQQTYGGRWMVFWPTEESDYTYRGL